MQDRDEVLLQTVARVIRADGNPHERSCDDNLRSLGTARTGAYFSTAPFLGAILSVLLWREPVTVTLLAAGGLMAFGVWLHLTERSAGVTQLLQACAGPPA